jgi:hypothetical protein
MRAHLNENPPTRWIGGARQADFPLMKWPKILESDAMWFIFMGTY